MRTHQYAHKKRAFQSARTLVPRPSEIQLSVQPLPIQAKSNEEGLAVHAGRLKKFERLGNSLLDMGPPRFSNDKTSPLQPKPWIQRNLTIGQPGDKSEQEADRVASQVVQQINAPSCSQFNQGQLMQREKELEGQMQSKGFRAAIQRRQAMTDEEASADLESSINNARGGGQPLDAGLQQSMGQAMGADFSGVKVHTDTHSDQLNQSIQARAFTTGQDVFFQKGAYQPGNRGGQELIAHELTHVVQQGYLGQVNADSQKFAEFLQCKMRSDQLNVAGEKHSESKKRRPLEKKFSEEKSGVPDYWTEQKFKIRRPNGEEIGQADTMYHRAIHIMTLMCESGDKISILATEIWRKKRILDSKLLSNESYIPELKKLYQPIDELIEDKQSYTKRLRNSYASPPDKKINDLYAQITSEWDKLYIFHTEAIKPDATYSNIMDSVEGMRSLANGLKDDLKKVRDDTGVNDSAEARDIRSKAMNQAAGFNLSIRGTWKIGQLHMDDIKALKPIKRKDGVNYLTREEFNAELKEWAISIKERGTKRKEGMQQINNFIRNSEKNDQERKGVEMITKIYNTDGSTSLELGAETEKWMKWEKLVQILLKSRDIDW